MFGGNPSLGQSGFGSGAPSQGSKNPFGAPAAPSPFGTTFGSQSNMGSTSSPWGASKPTNPAPSGFGSSNPFAATTSTFGSTSFGSSPAPTTSGFGGGGSGTGWGQSSAPVSNAPAPASAAPNPFASSSAGRGAGIFGSSFGGGGGAPATGAASGQGGFSGGTAMNSGGGHTFKCRVCQSAFGSSEELRKHIKAENHFDTSRVPGNAPAPGGFNSNFRAQPGRAPTAGSGDSFGAPPPAQGQSDAPQAFYKQASMQSFPQQGAKNPAQGGFSSNFRGQANRGTTASQGGGDSFGAQPPAPFPQGQSGAPQTFHQQAPMQSFPSQGAQKPPPPRGPVSPPDGAPRGAWARAPPSQDARMFTPHVKTKPPGAGPSGPGVPPGGGYRAQPQRGVNAFNPAATPFKPSASTAGAQQPPRGTPTPFTPMASAAPVRSLASAPALRSNPEAPVVSDAQSNSGGSSAEDASDAIPGDDGDRASDPDYRPGEDGDDGDSEDAQEEDEDDQDDLNFSFSSQESGGGDQSAGSSPAKNTRAAAAGIAPQPPAPAQAFAAAPAAGNGGGWMGRGAAGSSAAGQQARNSPVPRFSAASQLPSGADADHAAGADNTDATGTCEDMCPAAERQKRLNESDIHKLEIPHPLMTPGRLDYADTMVKKFQRSSADHALQIPHLLRTPEALLRSIEYIETELMDRASQGVLDPRIGEPPSPLFIYLFVWDRYRMVAKDFTLQISVLPLSRIWVECHERMARWFILMDHKMQAQEDFLSAGHGQQNGEQLNNLLKTLHGYYFRSRQLGSGGSASAGDSGGGAEIEMPNKAEFVCYFVIFQLGNGGEVSKYLQQLPDEILNSDPVRFAIAVWGALKTQNFARFFRLLRTRATLLQACLMHRYVGEVRLSALRKLTRSLNPPGASPQEYPLVDLVRNFMFESSEEAVEFLQKCGLSVTPRSTALPQSLDDDDETTEWVVPFKGQNIDSLLERDKNDRPIMPTTHYMHEWIDRSKSQRRPAHASIAPPGFATHYSIAEISRGLATSTAQPVTAPAPRAVPAAARIPASDHVRVRTPTNILGSAAAGIASAPTLAQLPASTADDSTPASTSTVINKTALRNKLMMSGTLGSGRGPKAATSPIPPVNDADIWGHSDSSTSSAKGNLLPGKKKTADAALKPPARQSPVPPGPVMIPSQGIAAAPSKAPAVAPKQKVTPQQLGTGGAVPSWPAPAAGSAWGGDASQKPAVAPSAPTPATGFNADSWPKPEQVSTEGAGKAPAKGGWGEQQSKVNTAPAFLPQSAPNAFPAFPAAPAPTAVPARASPATTAAVPSAAPASKPESSLKSAIFSAPSAAAIPATAQPADKAPVSAPAPKPAVAKVEPSVAAATPAPMPVPVQPPSKPARPEVNPAKLAAFEAKQRRREASKVLGGAMAAWRAIARAALEKRTLRNKALYFLFWRQSLRRVLKARQNFVQDITSIKLVGAIADGFGLLSLRGEGNAGGATPGLLKRKQADRIEADRQAQASAQAAAKERYHLLCDFPGGVTDGIEAVQKVRGVKTLLDTVGRTLRVVKTCQVRGLLGLPVPPSALTDLLQPTAAAAHTSPAFMTEGPTYSGPLCFKLALVSSAPSAGTESKVPEHSNLSAELRATDALRAVLANEVGFGFSSDSHTEGMGKGQLAKMRKRRGMLAKALATDSQKPTVRIGLHKHELTAQNTLLLSVVDVCGNQSMGIREMDQHTDLTGPVIAASSLAGAQGSVVVVSLTDRGLECRTQAEALFNVRRASHGTSALVLILLDMRTESQGGVTNSRGWCEFTASEVASAANASSGPLACAKKAVDELKLQGSKIGRGGDRIMDGLISCIAVSCPPPAAHMSVTAREALQRAVQILAASAPPTPLICRHRTAEWLHREFQKDVPIGPCTVVGVSVAPADPNPETNEARRACHSALAEEIGLANSGFHSLTLRMRALHSLTKDVASASHPAPDFAVTDSAGGPAPNGSQGLPKDSGSLAGGVCDVHQLQALAGGMDDQASEASHLPKNWAEMSRYDDMVKTLDFVRLPWWRHPQPLGEWQAQLVSFQHCYPGTFLNTLHPNPARERHPMTRAKDVLRALEAVLNDANETGNLTGVKASMKAIVRGLLTERLEAVMPELPAYFYAVLDKEEMPKLEAPAAMEAAPNGWEMSGFNAWLASPGAAKPPSTEAANTGVLGQAQHLQAFPTGFGRSLFGAFGNEPSFSSPAALGASSRQARDAYSAMDVEHRSSLGFQSPEAKARPQHDEVEDEEALLDTEALFTAAFKRSRLSQSTAQDQPVGLRTPSAGHDPRAREQDGQGNVASLQSSVAAENAAAARLQNLLEHTLRGNRFSALASPGGMTPGDEDRRRGSEGDAAMSAAAAMEDPLAFIQQCRLERERFEQSPF